MQQAAIAPPLSFDIFCRVVDNYGDIGVCWRLARRLAAMQNGPIRLWVDDLGSFARIARAVVPSLGSQYVSGVNILPWAPWAAVTPADVVIEAFACSPPPAYLCNMSARQIWINLEYLSAEAWVESCHGLPSLQSSGLRKYFFFPGFTPHTGGLLREPDLMARRDAWRSDPNNRFRLLQQLGLEADQLAQLQAGSRLTYVYCYPDAPLQGLVRALASTHGPHLILIPQGIVSREALTGLQTIDSRITIRTHQFVDQDRFDELLWGADLNIVRGEDSLVRAIWAARPMIWQPYRQAEDTHLEKLDAWLDHAPFSEDVRQAMRAWNRLEPNALASSLSMLLQPPQWQDWERRAHELCMSLASNEELADALVNFCAKIAQTR